MVGVPCKLSVCENLVYYGNESELCQMRKFVHSTATKCSSDFSVLQNAIVYFISY